jgi:hypothetical protein
MEVMMLGFLNVTLGGALLLAGRRLFWLLVGGIGFVIGVQLAPRLLRGSELLNIAVAIGLGILFALLAVFVESAAIGLAGFLGGGYILSGVASAIGGASGSLGVAAFIIGGIVGAAFIVVLFDWALVTISSLTGAFMVVDGFRLFGPARVVMYLALAILGIVIQGLALRRSRPSPASSSG